MQTIETARLVLEPLCAAHAAEMYPILRDNTLWELSDTRAPTSLSQLRARYERLQTRTSPDGRERWLNWIVRRTLDRAPMGFVQATVAEQSAEIAYVLGRSFWGHGYADEAVTAMLTDLRSHYDVRALVANVDYRNVRSIRLIERVGFQTTGIVTDSTLRYESQLLPPQPPGLDS